MSEQVQRARWYPEMPPALPDETTDQYTDRLTGADGTDRRPYDHHRNRQCSIGYHGECSDPMGHRCKCPCHEVPGSLRRFCERFAYETRHGTEAGADIVFEELLAYVDNIRTSHPR